MVARAEKALTDRVGQNDRRRSCASRRGRVRRFGVMVIKTCDCIYSNTLHQLLSTRGDDMITKKAQISFSWNSPENEIPRTSSSLRNDLRKHISKHPPKLCTRGAIPIYRKIVLRPENTNAIFPTCFFREETKLNYYTLSLS